MIELINIKDSMGDLNEVLEMVAIEWGKYFRSSKEEKYNKIKHAIEAEMKYPQIYVLKDDKKIVGSFTIKEHDLEDCDLTPWLSCVIIKKELRGRGYGRIILQYIKKVIEENYPEIYLTTQHIGYYEKIGFEFVKHVSHNGEIDRLYTKKTFQ